jgi:hypothetical protein
MAWLDLSTHRPAPLIARRRSFLRTGPRILLISGQSGPHLNLWDKCGEQVALAIRAERSERSNQPGSRPPLSWTNERAASLRNSPAFCNVAGCKGVRRQRLQRLDPRSAQRAEQSTRIAPAAVLDERASSQPAKQSGFPQRCWLQGSEEDSGFNGAIRAERAQRAEQSVLSCQRSARHLQVRRKLAAYG